MSMHDPVPTREVPSSVKLFPPLEMDLVIYQTRSDSHVVQRRCLASSIGIHTVFSD